VEGSGKVGTPCERRQWDKATTTASALRVVVVVAEVVEDEFPA
jgi:hypothetical protein